MTTPTLSREDFAEVWGSVEALRTAVATGYVKPGREESARLTLAAELDRLRYECAWLRQDAERYAWLRSVGGRSWTVLETQTPATGVLYDAATDAAMKGQP